MMKYLPAYERGCRLFQSLIDVESQEIDEKALDIDDLINQLSIDTATWGLSIYEDELGIKTEVSKSYEERRSLIKAKYRGIGKLDKLLLQSIVGAYSDGEVEISFDGKFKILLEYIRDNFLNLIDLESTLGEIKPAHLDYILSLQINSNVLIESKSILLSAVFPICNEIRTGGDFF